SEDTLKRIIPTIRMDFSYESNAIRDRNYPHFYSISDQNEPEDNIMQISTFMDITEDKAREIAHTPYLFAD
ncbi:MAG: glycosyl transferase, partial [Rhodobacteraceae bacterium]|nr:glycosyl transferase [Paracoccaceae bacterium]